MNSSIKLGCLIAFLALVGGCDSGPPKGVVRGTVQLDGQPVTQGAIWLLPDAGRGGNGEIKADGSFEIATMDTEGVGAVLGRTRLAVICYTEGTTDGSNPDAARYGGGKQWIVPEKFASPLTSGLEFEVTPEDNVLKIELTSDGSGKITKE